MKIKIFFISLIMLIISAGFALNYLLEALSPQAESDFFIIVEKGDKYTDVSKKLEAHAFKHNKIIFKLLGKYSNYHKKYIQIGEYQIKAGDDVFNILQRIIKGERFKRKITFPEGQTIYQIKKILAGADAIVDDLDSVLDLQEGYLYPDTYYYFHGDKASSIIQVMRKKTLDVIASSIIPKDHILKNFHEVLTLASIVEKETSSAAERIIVASVYLNRLKIGMPLQADPTVIYGAFNGQTDYNVAITREQLNTLNPYNTYLQKGLPPTPIASVSTASINAVLYPAETSFLYFVAVGDDSGKHNFATTLAEHNNNVAAYRKSRK